MAKKKPLAIVIGSFSDPARQIWSPDAMAFATAQEAVAYLGDRSSYYEDFAYELKVKKEEVPDALAQMNPVITMEALIRVLREESRANNGYISVDERPRSVEVGAAE